MGTVFWAALVAAAAAKLFQCCPTLCDPIDGSPLDSFVPGILQARTLEWVAISFSNAWKWKVKVKSLSHARLLATPWTAAYQAPPPTGFSRQEYWSGVPLPSSTENWFISFLRSHYISRTFFFLPFYVNLLKVLGADLAICHLSTCFSFPFCTWMWVWTGSTSSEI